jgi:superfamily I DNA/RNA helicase
MGQQSLFFVPTIESPRRKISTPKTKQLKKSFQAEQQFSLNVEQENSAKKNTTIDILHQLNDKQRQAVQYSAGPLMIVAGPGTGKTRTLTHRIAYLIRQKCISPQSILALTFTNKAAEEMRQRLQSLFIGAHQLPLVATFHALCLKILNDLDETKPVIIIDDSNRKNLLSEAIAYVEHKGIEVSLKSKVLLDRIIAAKQKILGPQDILKEAAGENEAKLVSEVYRTYQALLSIQGLNDYEDLIFKVVRLFESDDQVRRMYQDRYRHIFVDEYQDLNQGQYRIIRALAAPENSENDICVIGDPDQSIYGFRGSDIAYFKRFMQDYPNAGVIYLTQNYRSTGTILDASYQVIKDHRIQPSDSRTYSQIDGAKTISIYELANERAEAKAVARIIENLVGGSGFHSIDTGAIDDANLSKARSYSDFAVLYRTNEQHQIMAEVFEMTGIPFQIASREHAFKQFGVRELLSFLRVVEGCADYGDYETTMCHSIPGIGKKIPKHFKNWCYQNGFSLHDGLSKAKRFPVPRLSASSQQNLNDFTDRLMGLKKKIAGMTVAEKLIYLSENGFLSTTFDKDSNSRAALDHLVEFSKAFGNRVVDFFAAAALQADTDTYAFRVEKVSLMTMHAAKGLEFPIVFITGCEQDYIPFKRAGDAPQDIQEERRLFYVAMTRAMERLYFTRAKKRRIYGKMEFRTLSPFVADIETRLKKKEIPHTKKRKKKTDQKQLTLF